jgi:hypothetical protein
VALGAFLDTEGAFDRTSFGAGTRDANWYGVETTIDGSTSCWEAEAW